MRKNGDIIYEGDFVNNNFEGKGTLNKRGILYKGCWKYKRNLYKRDTASGRRGRIPGKRR